MDPSTAQHQEMAAENSLENMLVCSKPQQERKPRPQPEQALKCPRCDSTNTKFCYYNNYSLSQPRYFCKSCRRYWTKGGTLRNVPVGGGCRKNKRSSSSSKKNQDHHHYHDHDHDHDHQLMNPNTSNPLIATLPPLTYDNCNDLNLAFARLQKQSNGGVGFDDLYMLGNPNNNHCEFNHFMLGNSLWSGFLGTQNSNFQNLYFGNIGEVENNNGVCGNSGEIMIPYDDIISSCGAGTAQAVTVTTMKQEFDNGKENDDQNNNNNNSKVLWGFPWQLNGNGNGIGEVDSGKESWINGFGSTWHGLVNSPLM